jgi:hypothetical protein
MRPKSLTSCLLLAAGIVLSAPSQAVVLFSDSFDADYGSSVLNVGSLTNWTVSDGTIDYIRHGNQWGISCFGAAGACLDMDGSTGNAGRITSTSTFNLLPGVTYYLEGEVSGNQRGGASDGVTFGIADASNPAFAFTGTWGSIQPGSPFMLHYLGVGPVVAPLTVRIFVEGLGGDNVGVILDNVVFRDDTSGNVPEPGTLSLLGLGLAGLAASRRRKQ